MMIVCLNTVKPIFPCTFLLKIVQRRKKGKKCAIDADCLSNNCQNDKYPYFCAQ